MNFQQEFASSDPGQIKSIYRRLAFCYHPDRNPSADFEKYNAIMRDLNEAYHDALRSVDGTKFTGDDNREHTYHYNASTENGVIDAVARTIRANLPDRATVTIVGIYVWVEGLTRDDKAIHNVLKALEEQDDDERRAKAFRFHSKRLAWYWKPPKYRARYNPSRSLDDLKSYYGARVVQKDEDNALATA